MLAGVAIVLTGCVSTGDPAMYATQGFAPGSSSFVTLNNADQSDALMMASVAEDATSEGVPTPQPSPNAASPDQGAVEAQGASGQQLVMTETGVDALNQGITQNQPVQAAANLFSAPAPETQTETAAAEPATTMPAPAMDATPDFVATGAAHGIGRSGAGRRAGRCGSGRGRAAGSGTRGRCAAKEAVHIRTAVRIAAQNSQECSGWNQGASGFAQENASGHGIGDERLGRGAAWRAHCQCVRPERRACRDRPFR